SVPVWTRTISSPTRVASASALARKRGAMASVTAPSAGSGARAPSHSTQTRADYTGTSDARANPTIAAGAVSRSRRRLATEIRRARGASSLATPHRVVREVRHTRVQHGRHRRRHDAELARARHPRGKRRRAVGERAADLGGETAVRVGGRGMPEDLAR